MENQLVADNSISNAPPRQRLSQLIGSAVFYALLVLIVLVGIPYGTAEPWWKALCQCAIFVLAGFCVVERLVRTEPARYHIGLALPVVVLILYSLIQTISWSNTTVAGVDQVLQTVSADPYQTRLFAIQLLSLLSAGILLVLYTNSRRRVQILVDTVIAIGVFTAFFGLLRQALQTHPGFILPYLIPDFGYAQFINKNHFGFLMEMALGLALGVVVCRGAGKARVVFYLAAAAPMWIALIWSNSRAGIVSLLFQVLFLGLVASANWRPRRSHRGRDQSRSTPRMWAFRVVLIVGLMVGAIFTIILFGGESLDRRLGLISVELNTKTADAYVLRQNIWQATTELIKANPITGVGFGAYWIAISKYHHSTGEITPQEAHSDYLELLASGGVIGVAIGVWFLFAFLRRARQRIREADRYGRAVSFGALAGIVAIAVHSLVEYGLHITINAVVFTVLIALVVIDVPAAAPDEEMTSDESIRSSSRPRLNSRSMTIAAMVVGVIVFTPLALMRSTDSQAPAVAAAPSMAILTVHNGRTVTVNGIVVASGATILSGNTIETSRPVSGLVSIGSLGQIDLNPDTTATIGFAASSISAVLLKGCVNLQAAKGASAEIHTSRGAVKKIDATTGGTLNYCVNEALPAANRAVLHQDLFSLGEYASRAIIFGRRSGDSLTQSRRGNNPGPSAP